MTNEQHIENLKKLKSFHNGSYGADIDKAIQALEQEPKIVPIAEIKFDDDMLHEIVEEAIKNIEIEIEPKTGHWIEDTNGTYTDNHDTWECSECGHAQILLEGTPKDNDYNYCPNCGAKMVEPQESEDKE